MELGVAPNKVEAVAITEQNATAAATIAPAMALTSALSSAKPSVPQNISYTVNVGYSSSIAAEVATETTTNVSRSDSNNDSNSGTLRYGYISNNPEPVIDSVCGGCMVAKIDKFRTCGQEIGRRVERFNESTEEAADQCHKCINSATVVAGMVVHKLIACIGGSTRRLLASTTARHTYWPQFLPDIAFRNQPSRTCSLTLPFLRIL